MKVSYQISRNLKLCIFFERSEKIHYVRNKVFSRFTRKILTMEEVLKKLYQSALLHREIHDCGAVPYQNGNLLVELASKPGVKRILEIGTGVGFSTACLAMGNKNAIVETVDKDAIHIMFAKENIEKLALSDKVTFYQSKVEDVFPTLKEGYDLIFCDGHVPQRKFAPQFERLLKKGGIAITANLFLSVPSGGKYLKSMQSDKWNTKVIGDTAISIKI